MSCSRVVSLWAVQHHCKLHYTGDHLTLPILLLVRPELTNYGAVGRALLRIITVGSNRKSRQMFGASSEPRPSPLGVCIPCAVRYHSKWDGTKVNSEDSLAYVEAMLVKRHDMLLRFAQQLLPVLVLYMRTSCHLFLLLQPTLLAGLDCGRTHVPRSTAPPVEYG